MKEYNKLPLPILLVSGFLILVMFIFSIITLLFYKCSNNNICFSNLLEVSIPLILISIGLLLNFLGFVFFVLKDKYEEEEYYRKNNFIAGFWLNILGFFIQFVGVAIQLVIVIVI